MLPDEREYRVGPRGYVTKRDGATVRYEPGSLVWLRGAPPPADFEMTPTGRTRKYETKGVLSTAELRAVLNLQPNLDMGLSGIDEALKRLRRRRGPSEES